MATVRQIFTQMRDVQEDLCRRLGVDIPGSQKTLRATAMSGLAIDALIVKALLDKGVLTAADLNAALAAAQAESWPDEPTLP